MAKKILPVPITADFESDLATLNEITGPNKSFSRSKVIRNAIRMWLALYRATPKRRLKVAEEYIQKLFYEPNTST